jgi:hypothetical protein
VLDIDRRARGLGIVMPIVPGGQRLDPVHDHQIAKRAQKAESTCDDQRNRE